MNTDNLKKRRELLIKEKNDGIAREDNETVIDIFQRVSLSGILFMSAIISIFSYFIVKENLNYNIGMPVITTDVLSSNSTAEQRNLANQIFDRFLSLRTDFEIQEFIKESYAINKDDLLRDKTQADLKNLVSEIKGLDSLGYKILESHKTRGDSFYSEKEGRTVLTSSEYYFIVKQMQLTKGSKQLLPDPYYYAYVANFDSDMKIKSIKRTDDELLTTKYRYLDFLKELTPQNITSRVALNSTVSHVALSYMNIQKVSFFDFVISKSISGTPTAKFKLVINNEVYSAYVKTEANGTLALYIS